MMAGRSLGNDGRTVTVRVPMALRRRGGRKLVLSPDGTNLTATSSCRQIDNAMVKAIARAFRWREMLENGDYATLRDLAKTEAINEVYLGRVLRLTLLKPDIVDAILDGTQPASIELHDLLNGGLAGGQVGCNYQTGQLVLGVEGEGYGRASEAAMAPGSGVNPPTTQKTKLTIQSRVVSASR